MNNLNPHISVDCVVFGFDSFKLKVLLLKRAADANGRWDERLKLPGSMIINDEDLEKSAYRTLKEITGLDNVFLKQSGVFGKPDRLITNQPNDLNWLQHKNQLQIDRIVSIAYYALVKIDDSNSLKISNNDLVWMPIEEMPQLMFDHSEIVNHSLMQMQKELRMEPIGFELLPKKFTLRQLQSIYEVILNKTIDTRNFRKKIRTLTYLIPLPEKEVNVNHKPAQLYKFDRKNYEKQKREMDFVM